VNPLTFTPAYLLPPLIVQLVTDLKAIDPRAHIAGGAIRDLLLGKQVKDYDIFVPAFTDDAFQSIKGGITQMDVQKMLGAPTYSDYGRQYHQWDPELMGVANYKIDGCDVQVIWVKSEHADIYQNVERFDLGVCRVGCDTSWSLVYGDGFVADVRDKVFRLRTCKNPSQFSNSISRINRLKQKYIEWGVYIPAQFGDYFDHSAFTRNLDNDWIDI